VPLASGGVSPRVEECLSEAFALTRGADAPPLAKHYNPHVRHAPNVAPTNNLTPLINRELLARYQKARRFAPK
jgi:hypothetical protein